MGYDAGGRVSDVTITGAHTIIYSEDADRTRAFLRDVLGFPSVDVGGGWLIFKLPPGELASHPDATGGRHELYFMCDDVQATIDDLTAKGAAFTAPVSDQGWGLLTSFKLPGAGEVGLYEPRHPVAHSL